MAFRKRERLVVTKLSVFGDDKSVRSQIGLLMHNGRIYIETSDNESGANNRTAKIALSPNRMRLLGETLVGLANGDDLDKHKGEHWNGVTSTVSGDGL